MTMALTRRRMIEEPPSQLAIWALRLAIFSLLVAVLAIGIEQWGALEIIPVLVTFGAALALAVFAILVAVAAFVMLWINGGPGAGAAVTGVIISLMLLGYPGYLGYRAYTLPAIKDITTDPIDPPRFEVVARLRPPNTSDYPGLATAELQKDAYPDVEPLLVKVAPAVAYDDAMKIITKRKWRVFDSRPPQPGREGHIEAIARSPRRPHRCPLGVALRLYRFRRQCRPGGSPAGRHRRPRRHPRAPETGQAAGQAGPEKDPSAPRRQAVAAEDRRRPVGGDEAARHQVFQMGEGGQPGRPGEPGIEPDIDCAHQCRNIGLALVQAM